MDHRTTGPHCWQCSGNTLQVHLAGGGKVYTNGANVFSVVFTPPPPSHHGCISYYLLTLPIYMIGEVSWEPKRRRAWSSQYLIPRRSISTMSIVLAVKKDTNCTSILLVVEGIHHGPQIYIKTPNTKCRVS
jgi:hypothetical protein